jgi:hypothetical protein
MSALEEILAFWFEPLLGSDLTPTDVSGAFDFHN